MKNQEIFERKLKYFFHDPINKPFILMQTDKSHEEIAKEFAGILNINLPEDNTPDFIASAMERIVLPDRNRRIKFVENPEIIHSLSGEKLKNVDVLKENSIINKSIEICLNTFEEINKNTKEYDVKLKYFFIWRNLLSLLKSKSSEEIKKYWDVLPADTRVPDHSIFQHLKTTAMCSFCSSDTNYKRSFNKSSFLLFSIGPVQSFIETSRKLSDLYWGSYFLSYLSWLAIRTIIDKYGPDSIIFPDLLEQPLVDEWLEKTLKIKVFESNSNRLREATLPNRFLALIPEIDQKVLKELGKELENSIYKEFEDISKFIENKIGIKSNLILEDLKEYFELNWVFLPLENSVSENFEDQDYSKIMSKYKEFIFLGDYNDKKTFLNDLYEKSKINRSYPPNWGNIYDIIYQIIEKMMGCRKNIKEINFIEREGNKCDLCGERIIFVHNRKKHSSENAFDLSQLNINNVEKYIKKNEGLCSVCFLKRILDDYFQEKFEIDSVSIPSISSITLIKEIKNIEEKNGKKKYYYELKQYLGNFFDPQLLYKNELNKSYFEENGILDKLEYSKELINKLDLKNLPKYYAAIVMDGDDMGKWLSGEKAPVMKNICNSIISNEIDLSDLKRPLSPALHLEISKALKNYSLHFVKRIIEEKYQGKLIYSGGDDVLALVNIEDLLNMINDLRAAFSGNIDTKLTANYENKNPGFYEEGDKIFTLMGEKATMSAGICIAHYKEPLSIVLRNAREMEKIAKQYNHNTNKKNAFCIRILKHSGETEKSVYPWYFDENGIKTTSISYFNHLIKEFKETKISDSFIYDLYEEFSKLNLIDNGKIEKILEIEIERIIKRKYSKIGDKSRKDKTIEIVKKIYFESISFDNFINILKILRFIAKKGE